jgi:nitrate/nitrite-specific signal transduction histidine kinase
VIKHAQASQVAIGLHSSPTAGVEGEGKTTKLYVSDDGRGFDMSDVKPGELGLGIMHERAQAIDASLQIESQPGHGTQVLVMWKG